MSKENKIKVTKIYDEIIKEDETKTDTKKREPESFKRLLRSKFSYLMEDIMLRDPSSYKAGNNDNVILKSEEYIIKHILIQSIEETSIIGKWFNKKLDLSSSENIIDLFGIISEIIEQAFSQGYTDKVTADEWLATIKSSIDYINAKKVIEVKSCLDNLRLVAKPLNHEVGLGDIIINDDDGYREYILTGNRRMPEDIGETTINQLLEYAYSEKIYYNVLQKLIIKFIEHAEKSSYNLIFQLAELKKASDFINDDEETYNARDMSQGISEYLQFYKKIYEFLRENPKILQQIESKAGTTNLLEFFNV